ncbi:MAG: hypothetical protein JNJ55_07100 [Betaproteobacteria bacterium]|nr:hypothetical protein [Betaproteobacteria bacterium]
MMQVLCMVLSALLTALPVAAHGETIASSRTLRLLPADFGTRKAVAYSPYRTAKNVADRDNENITPAMIREDLNLLAAGGFTLIRLFDSSDKVARQTLRVIRDDRLDIKVMLGIYVQHDNPSFTLGEIERGIALAREYKDIIVAVSVGNETMVSWSFNRFDTAAMKRHIDVVRAAVVQPVTTDDNWAFFAWNQRKEQDPAAILASIDFVAMHTYPVLDSVYSPDLWDWRQAAVPASRRAAAMVEAAAARARFEYGQVRSHVDSLGLKAMPIIIGETGWQADPAMVPFRSHPVNQKMYYDAMNAWLASGNGPRAIFHFEAFDEPWKEADDKWGLFNVKRQARFVVQDLYPREIWEPGAYAMKDAAYVVPIAIRPAISARRYTVHARSRATGKVRPALESWRLVQGSATVRAGSTLRVLPGGAQSTWVVARKVPNNAADDLSAFADGNIHFRIKSTRHIELDVGFDVGSATEGSAFMARMPLSSGQYGFHTDGAWHSVTIPVGTIRQFVAAREKVGLSRIDLARVTSPIVIGGRSSAPGSLAKGAVEIDGVYWSR